jgi:ring-1,2-phenylacetyl-CoA epoxidase subunit PaaB
VKSLDPRVNRLPELESSELSPKAPLDQWGNFEVFVQPKEGKPFQHEGAVHAVDLELAYVLAKETFTRRFLCTSLFVADTRSFFVTAYSDNGRSIYDEVTGPPTGGTVAFEIFHLLKRGKQHVHAGQVFATSHADALSAAKQQFALTTPVYNIWVIRTDEIRFTSSDEKDLWLTLPDKKFRDASDYKAGDRLKTFTERN